MNCRQLFLTCPCILPAVGILLANCPSLAAQDLAPVPSDAAQQKAVKLIEEVYGEEHTQAKTSAEKTALAGKLLKEAAASEDLTNRYVLLRVARDMATEAGDAETAVRAVEEIGKSFQVDLLQLKGAALSAARKSASLSKQRKALAEQALALIEEAVARDDFVAARYLAQLALDAARKAREGDLTKRIVARSKMVTEVAEEYSAAKDAFQTLEEKPVDPEANLAAGKYLCFTKGNWDKGIPMLALGKDGQTTKLAIKELEGVTDVGGQVAIGDGWWALSETKDGLTKKRARERAVAWYRLAFPKLTGLVKAKVEKRLAGSTPETKSYMPLDTVATVFSLPKTDWKIARDVLIGRVGDAEDTVWFRCQPFACSACEFEFKIRAKWYHRISVNVDGREHSYSRGHWKNTGTSIVVDVERFEQKGTGPIVANPGEWAELRGVLRDNIISIYYNEETVIRKIVARKGRHNVVLGFGSYRTTVEVKDFRIQSQ